MGNTFENIVVSVVFVVFCTVVIFVLYMLGFGQYVAAAIEYVSDVPMRIEANIVNMTGGK